MSNTNATENIKQNVEHAKPSGWGKLAKDTETELASAKERVKKLKIALRIFTENAQRGESYPVSGNLDQPTNT
jgi:hypothetical protein